MPTIDRTDRIAIVGAGGIFPGAHDLDTFWNHVAEGIDSGRHAPADRWYLSPEKAFRSEGPLPDRVYSTWGCFIEGFEFDPAGLNIDRDLLSRLDPMLHLGLHAARAAVRDARQLAGTDRNRVGVILGNIVLPTQSTSAMCRDVLGRTFFEKLSDTIPLSPLRRAEARLRVPADGRWDPLNRFAASLPAALIAQGLDLGGLAYTLDAACASSLYALKFACEELRAHRADAMLAGGMSRPDCQYTQMGFAQLKALSRSGRCAPLSAAADGLVVGEGAGVFVLKRLEDAVVASDHIYGIIAGIGLSNDRGANLLAPHSEGQLRAMRSAYEEAGWQPGDVDLMECHATGTPVGDGVEIASLHELWRNESSHPGQCVIGGVKSNIGHLLTGAGAAGLMKVLFALKHQTLPPTANYVSPASALTQNDSPFRVLARSEPWLRRGEGAPAATAAKRGTRGLQIPRRATINAFGFGGINAHVLIEEFLPVSRSDARRDPVPVRFTVQDLAIPTAASDLALDIAIVGIASRIGGYESFAEFQQQSTFGRGPVSAPSTNDWGVAQTDWYRQEIGAGPAVLDAISTVVLPLGEFRIPPLEMQDMLPQQQLMLKMAHEALQDAARGKSSRAENGAAPDATTFGFERVPTSVDPVSLGNRTGVFVGIELDPNTANFHLRWSIEQDIGCWADALGLELSAAELDAWTDELKRAASPPLTANGVMGNLGGIVASRLAREFNIGGSSFTISANGNSGLRACELAAHALYRRELDRALVGAVELPTEIRTRVAAARSRSELNPGPVCDGATALVLKRLDDAWRDGDFIHGVIRTIGANEETSALPTMSSSVSFGAATGLIDLVGALTSLQRQTRLEPTPHPWLRNRSDGERRIRVSGHGVDGRNFSVELSESPNAARPRLDVESVTAVDAVSNNRSGQPGPLPVCLFVIDGNSVNELAAGLEQLERSGASSKTLPELAANWFGDRTPRSDHPLAVVLLVRQRDELPDVIRAGLSRIHAGSTLPDIDRRVFFSRRPLGREKRLAFVFPGSGNAFLGMGRELLTAFPAVLRRQEAENKRLRDQYRPELIWYADSTQMLLEDHKAMIFGQVALGTAICDLLALFGIRPTASLGYSLGESAALFGLRAWTDRDEMLARMDAATLFGSDLVRPFNAARRAWNIPEGIAVPWISGIVDRSATEIRAVMRDAHLATIPPASAPPRIYLLIINTSTQCVIGGDRDEVDRLVGRLGAKFVPFPAPSTVHCEILRQVEPAYRALHLMRTTPPSVGGHLASNPLSIQTDGLLAAASDASEGAREIDFYSAASGATYKLSRESAAEAIVAQAVDTIDFPRVVEQACADGVGLFVEIGPGSSCTRMIDDILRDRPHWARAACPATVNPVSAFLELLAGLIAERVPVDLSHLYGKPTPRQSATTDGDAVRQIVTPVGRAAFEIPVPAGGWRFQPLTGQSPETFEGADIAADRAAEQIDASVAVREMASTPRVEPVEVLSPPTFLSPVADRPVQTPPFNPTGTPVAVAVPMLLDDTQKTIPDSDGTNVMTQLEDMLAARAKAHETYLRVSAQAQRVIAEQLAIMMRIANGQHSAETIADSEIHSTSQAPDTTTLPPASNPLPPADLISQPAASGSSPPRSLTRSQCMEFAIGKVGGVLGPMFAGIDDYPTRVRLPDEPLMLVDRILEIEGEPLSMTSGRVVTEHDIQPGAWYLDCGRIPTCIAVEAGQADLFLSGWLGVDFETRGLASYRLLDAVVTFHRELPPGGSTIHYDIRVNHFFRQGQTYLFRFEFDATVDGQPLLTMREGCAGFFSEPELARGKGIVHTALDRQPRPGRRASDWRDPVPMAVEKYSDTQLLSLRHGQLEACFGQAFANLKLAKPVTIPGLDAHDNRTRMWLIDRVLSLDPQGGKFGLGIILGELDIHPDDWFLTCHFCDDQVMPGTLMYECCLHTLRVYLLRMGWIGETGQIACEPVVGIRSRLKCRGQVLAGTRKVWYEITLKEIGYGTPAAAGRGPAHQASDDARSPEFAYCLADALMYADGKPIVEITDMSIQLTGLTRGQVEALWAGTAQAPGSRPMTNPPIANSSTPPEPSQAAVFVRYDRRPALFDTDRITAFATGNPSDAFGDRYRVFDSQRVIARLPGPPFQFLDRIVSINGCEPWVLQAGGEVVAQYDIPPGAWYFSSNRQRRMPFAVLLETALQPCGWLAGYVGSALTSDTDLSFRNLGGTATQFRDVTAESGTLTTTVKMTRVSNSGGMIIQHYDFDLRCDGEPVYTGNTYFGFFSRASLVNQIGIRDAKPFIPSPDEASRCSRFPYVDAAPFADSRFQMIDDVRLSLDAGPHGHGFAIGTTTVDPAAWFFKAHFHQDPVVPGSLGLESFFQLVKLYAARRWQLGDDAQFATPIVQREASAINRGHEWVYRGQVVPHDHVVTVTAVLKTVDDSTRELTAEGYLSVDGRVIYQMKEFSLGAA